MSIDYINRIIALDENRELEFKTTYWDSLDSWVRRMVDACTEAKVSLPRHEMKAGYVSIIFDRPKRTVPKANVLENVTENATSLAELFNVTERTIIRDLSKLQSLGIPRDEDLDKGGRRVVLKGAKIATTT